MSALLVGAVLGADDARFFNGTRLLSNQTMSSSSSLSLLLGRIIKDAMLEWNDMDFECLSGKENASSVCVFSVDESSKNVSAVLVLLFATADSWKAGFYLW